MAKELGLNRRTLANDAARDPEATLAMTDDRQRQIRKRLREMEAEYERVRERPDVFYELLVFEAGIATFRTTLRWHVRAVARVRRKHLGSEG